MEVWHTLMRKALGRLEYACLTPFDWVMGGGTALSLRYHHRVSHDIDLFLNDVQYLSYLTPRLSNYDQGGEMAYREGSNHLRIYYDDGEIDFLVVSPLFPDLKPVLMQVEELGLNIPTMPDEEILAQKIHYRAAGFTGRDLYDFACVSHFRPDVLQDDGLWRFANQKADAVSQALSSKECEVAFYALNERQFDFDYRHSREKLLDWMRGQAPRD